MLTTKKTEDNITGEIKAIREEITKLSESLFNAILELKKQNSILEVKIENINSDITDLASISKQLQEAVIEYKSVKNILLGIFGLLVMGLIPIASHISGLEKRIKETEIRIEKIDAIQLERGRKEEANKNSFIRQ
ncbi:MAG: hypothetical protein CV045_08435 [Cyanobacteria bacterium M5B4]|nr:MAG: hypothetical protein CV045_08435 [Cyanobacteria bacterium M5B4]